LKKKTETKTASDSVFKSSSYSTQQGTLCSNLSPSNGSHIMSLLLWWTHSQFSWNTFCAFWPIRLRVSPAGDRCITILDLECRQLRRSVLPDGTCVHFSL